MISILTIQATEGSVTEPVTLDDVKDWLEVDFDDKDEMLSSMITGARQSVEKFLNCHLVAKSVTMDIENTKDDYDTISFPGALAVSGVSVSELDDYDVATVGVAGTDYYVRANVLRVPTGRFTVSYTTVPGTIPQAIKEAIMMEIAERYRARGENTVEGKNGLSEAAKEKLYPYQIVWL